MLKVYTYQNCSTCRNATKWLRAAGVPYTEIPIRQQPPTLAELRKALDAAGGKLASLFNTSGQDYRALELKERLPQMTEDEALALLSKNGNLVRRPFAIDPEANVTLQGFREPAWKAALGA